MNQRNVEALRVLLEEEERERNVADEYVHSPAELRAQFLASRGVLVPSTLTDHEVDFTVDSGESRSAVEIRNPDDFRATLERIAKGGP